MNNVGFVGVHNAGFHETLVVVLVFFIKIKINNGIISVINLVGTK